MTGKKFNAAEKHFEKKRIKMARQIDVLTKENSTLFSKNEELLQSINSFESENSQLKQWVERLLTYTELKKDDIKAVCEKEKASAMALKTFTQMAGIMGKFA